MDKQPDLLARLVPTAAAAKRWRAVIGVCLVFGLLAAANTLWIIGTDLHARQSWPRTRGELTSIAEESSAGVDRASRRTRYWVRYAVRSEIKLAEQPVWLRYQWNSIGVLAVWLAVFGGGLILVRRRVRTV